MEIICDCPVCGYPGLKEPARRPSTGGSFEICVSCGFQFGYTDDALGITDGEWREGWVWRGMPWSGVGGGPPPAWNPGEQLRAAGLWPGARARATWVETLGAARRLPRMYIGNPASAHLYAGFYQALLVVWEQHAFVEPQRACLDVSPDQFFVRCLSGPLSPEHEQATDWATQDHLLVANPICAACGRALFLADRGLIAIRTSAGLWCQAYEGGWPTTAPYLVSEGGEHLGLVVAAALSTSFFKGLPFTLEAVQRAIRPAAEPYTEVQWHPDDDILPSGIIDPQCVLHPRNIGRWLDGG